MHGQDGRWIGLKHPGGTPVGRVAYSVRAGRRELLQRETRQASTNRFQIHLRTYAHPQFLRTLATTIDSPVSQLTKKRAVA